MTVQSGRHLFVQTKTVVLMGAGRALRFDDQNTTTFLELRGEGGAGHQEGQYTERDGHHYRVDGLLGTGVHSNKTIGRKF